MKSNDERITDSYKLCFYAFCGILLMMCLLFILNLNDVW